MEHKTAAGIPTAVRTTATGLDLPAAVQNESHGAASARGRFNCLSTLREEHQGIPRIKASEQTAVPAVDSSRIHVDQTVSWQEPQTTGSTAFVAASDGGVGHQAHLQQALTRDGEKPIIVSCCDSAPLPP